MSSAAASPAHRATAARPAPSRVLTRQALLAAITPQADAAVRWLGGTDLDAVDWEWLIERADSHRVASAGPRSTAPPDT